MTSVQWKEFRGRGRPAVSVDVRADGKRQVLTVSDFVEEKSLYRRRTASTAGTLSRQDTFTSLGVDAYEVKTQALESAPSLVFKLDFDGVGLSLLNKRLVEVVYLTMQGIRVEYTLSQSAQGIVFSCENIQIDNQLQEGLYPVVLQPTPLPRNNGPIRSPPVVQVSLIVLNDNGEQDMTRVAAVPAHIASRTRSNLREVRVGTATGYFCPAGRGLPLRGLRLDKAQGCILGRRAGKVCDLRGLEMVANPSQRTHPQRWRYSRTLRRSG